VLHASETTVITYGYGYELAKQEIYFKVAYHTLTL